MNVLKVGRSYGRKLCLSFVYESSFDPLLFDPLLYELIALDFEGVDIFTDSFIQQLTVILSQEVGFEHLKKRVKFRNLNDFLLKMVKEKFYLNEPKR